MSEEARVFTFPVCDDCGESTYTCKCEHPENLPPAHPEKFVPLSDLRACEERAERKRDFIEAEPVVEVLRWIVSDLERNGTVQSANYNRARALLTQLEPDTPRREGR